MAIQLDEILKRSVCQLCFDYETANCPKPVNCRRYEETRRAWEQHLNEAKTIEEETEMLKQIREFYQNKVQQLRHRF